MRVGAVRWDGVRNCRSDEQLLANENSLLALFIKLFFFCRIPPAVFSCRFIEIFLVSCWPVSVDGGSVFFFNCFFLLFFFLVA